MNDILNTCYIISGGPETIESVEILNDAFIICADSGYDKAINRSIDVDMVIGDFDSIKNTLPDTVNQKVLPVKKDETDTYYCAKKAIELGYKQIIILGGSGGRSDHFLANLQTLKFIDQCGCVGAMLGDNTNVYYLKGKSDIEIKKEPSMYLSLLSLCDDTVVSITGSEYDVCKYRFVTSFPIGVSNHIVDDSVRIDTDSGELLVMTVRE